VTHEEAKAAQAYGWELSIPTMLRIQNDWTWSIYVFNVGWISNFTDACEAIEKAATRMLI
jgi:hypothetical protein